MEDVKEAYFNEDTGEISFQKQSDLIPIEEEDIVLLHRVESNEYRKKIVSLGTLQHLSKGKEAFLIRIDQSHVEGTIKGFQGGFVELEVSAFFRHFEENGIWW